MFDGENGRRVWNHSTLKFHSNLLAVNEVLFGSVMFIEYSCGFARRVVTHRTVQKPPVLIATLHELMLFTSWFQIM